MICVSIAQESHRFALVDMLNAGRRCDLIEIRLDRFQKPPDVKALLEACPKPAIVSCRRRQDGGDWAGSEEARLALLRQAVLEKAAYVEIEFDCIDQVRRYGDTKRVLAFTNMTEVPEDIERIYEKACRQDIDVVKLTVPTRTPEEAWPVLKIVAKGKVPTVAVGLGRNGIMLNVLGRRYKAPWTYAALEKGMEAYPGMPSIFELEEAYDYRSIDSKTPLLAVAGFSEEQLLTARVLNHGFRLAENKTRCLPIEMGNVEHFGRICSAIKLAGVVVDEEHREAILSVTTQREEAVELAGAADFISIQKDHWSAYNTVYRAVLGAIEHAYQERHPGESAVQNRSILVVGCSGTGRSIAVGLMRRGAKVILADADNNRAAKLADRLGTRYMAAGQVYTAMCDGIVLCQADSGPVPRGPAISLPRSAAREGMIALDLSNYPNTTHFLDEVRVLGGIAVPPSEVFFRAMKVILHACTGRHYSDEEIRAPLREFDFDHLPSDE